MEYTPFKFELYPTKQQKEQLVKTFGCSRKVYNHFLTTCTDHRKETGKNLSRLECNRMLTKLKDELPYLREVASSPLVYSIMHLFAAFDNVRRGIAKYPKYKSGHRSKQSFTSQSCWIVVKDGKTYASLMKFNELGLGLIRCRGYKPNEIPAKEQASSATVSCRHGRYFISVLYRDIVKQPLPKTGKQVGLDLGIKHLVTTSDGQRLGKEIKRLDRLNRQLAKRSRVVSRKYQANKKPRQPKDLSDCRNYVKARNKLGRKHMQIANVRSDILHKLTRMLVETCDLICIEDLDVKTMQGNKQFASKLQQVCFGELRRQLEYKCELYGKRLVAVSQWFASSQLCSNCGCKNSKITDVSIRSWKCPSCGTKHDRDINAAVNILNEGLTLV